MDEVKTKNESTVLHAKRAEAHGIKLRESFKF